MHSGESLLVAGASGSGKSTLCRASIGLVPHFYGGEFVGRVLVDGLDTREHPVHNLFGHAGLAFQNPDAQLFNQTVEAELAYGLESLGLSPAEIDRRLTWVSDLVELAPLMRRSPHSLSGGEKQRVILGAILSLRPRLLLLDEPFTHLDPETADRLRVILKTIRAEGIAVVVVEHRLHEVVADVDRLVIFHQGRLVADGQPRQVLGQDIMNYGLNLPPLVRFFRERNWPESPLTIAEALPLLKDRIENPIGPHVDPRHPAKLVSPERACPGRSHLGFGLQSSVIEVNSVDFSYDGQRVLEGVSLNLGRGECVALVGRNGSGKPRSSNTSMDSSNRKRAGSRCSAGIRNQRPSSNWPGTSGSRGKTRTTSCFRRMCVRRCWQALVRSGLTIVGGVTAFLSGSDLDRFWIGRPFDSAKAKRSAWPLRRL